MRPTLTADAYDESSMRWMTDLKKIPEMFFYFAVFALVTKYIGTLFVYLPSTVQR